MSTANGEEKIWFELTDKREDWKSFFEICQRVFSDDPFYAYTHPDEEKRRQFLAAYFDYYFESVFKDGRGILALFKAKEFTGTKIIGGICQSLSRDEKALENCEKLVEIDEEGWKRYDGSEQFETGAYFRTLQNIAKRLGTTLLSGEFHVMDNGYREKGISTRLVMATVRAMRDEAMRRQKIAGVLDPKPPITFTVCENERSRNFLRKTGSVEVAEFRTHYSGQNSGEVSECWVFLYPPDDPTWVDIVRKEFNYRSKL